MPAYQLDKLQKVQNVAASLVFIENKFCHIIYLQALSNLTGDPYRAHCSINRVPRFKFNNIYKVIRCPQKDNRIISENTKLHVQEIVTPLLLKLQWLPVEFRINFKILL